MDVKAVLSVADEIEAAERDAVSEFVRCDGLDAVGAAYAARGKAAPKRAKKDWKWKTRGHRRCIVDEVEYESIAAAARAVGVNNNSLGRALRDGLAVYRGHCIRWCA